MSRRRRRSEQLEQLVDDRSALEIRTSIYDRLDVEHDGRPTTLRRALVIEAIATLDDEQEDIVRAVAGPLDVRQLRRWLADLASVQGYTPCGDRSITYHREELLHIDGALERAGGLR